MTARTVGGRGGPCVYAVGLLTVWIIYWLAFFPGVIMQDALDQWGQIVTGQYDNWHPVFHTWSLWLITYPWHSFGAVSLVQVLLTGLLMGQFLAMIRRLGAPGWMVWGGVFWLAVSPVFGWNVIAVWKDTAFSIAMLWTTALMLMVIYRGTVTPWCGIAIGTALSLVWLFRHNGPGVVVPVIIALAWMYWHRGRTGVLTAVLVCTGCVVLVEGPLYHRQNVSGVPTALKEQHLISQVAALVHAGTPMSDEDRDFLGAMLPIATWRSAYDCVSGNDLLFHSGMRTSLLDSQPWRLVGIWMRLAAQNPRAFGLHWLCATRFIWSIHSRLYIGPLLPDGGVVDPNEFGIGTHSVLPAAQRVLTGIIEETDRKHSPFRAAIWQPATALYLTLGALGMALWRARVAAPLLVWLPALANTAVWLVFAHSPGLRFQWPLMLLTPPLICLAAADWTRLRGANSEGDEKSVAVMSPSVIAQGRTSGRGAARVLQCDAEPGRDG
jgi:hypothetical protein